MAGCFRQGWWVFFLVALMGCAETGSDSGSDVAAGERSITVYSGRSESLVGSLLDRFSASTGIEVEVRYADTSELAATLLEEGDRTPADVFISQDAAALGALSKVGLLKGLDPALLSRVPAHFSSHRGDWVGLSGRARVVVYNPERIAEEELPQTLDAVTHPRYSGKFGLAPANASFQAHMAVLRAVKGPEALATWLGAVKANQPVPYPKNSAIVEAVVAGEVDWGLVNHYYLWRLLQQRPDAPGRNYFMPGGGVSSFINVAGAAVLSDDPAALELVDYLLSSEAQSYFAEETFEYPLVAGVETSVDLVPLSELKVPSLDYGEVSDNLEATLRAIADSGLLP